MDAIDTLRQEHRTVMHVVKAAERRLAADPGPTVADVELFLDFFRYYTTTCHDPKEEQLLFSMLHRRGLSWDGYPLCELMREHEALRVTLESTKDWLPKAKAGDLDAMEQLLHNVRAYLELVTRHIAKEEEEIFPMASHWLSPNDLWELISAYNAIAFEECTQGMDNYYLDLAHRLSAA